MKKTATTKKAVPVEKLKTPKAKREILFKCPDCGHLVYTDKEVKDNDGLCICCGTGLVPYVPGVGIAKTALKGKKADPALKPEKAPKASKAVSTPTKAPKAEGKAPKAHGGDYDAAMEKAGAHWVEVPEHTETKADGTKIAHRAYGFWSHTKASREKFEKLGYPTSKRDWNSK